jgi:CRISPR/Cas system type I-B associated protein Csh2 (Cas7 group RAMP superfamily)
MELKVKGNRARDWWGIDPAIAAGYAKVEVSYQDGTKKVATVSANYDAKNDWINLRAYGFTYSSPQLAVSFKAPAQATKTVPVKKTTITCVKGKVTKKVTAVKPKCPTGYKKK